MAIRLTDLRNAAMQEYPELRPPEPGLWAPWQVRCWVAVMTVLLPFDVILIIVLTITAV